LAADLQRTFLGRIRTKHERRYRLLYKTAKRRLQSEIEQIQLSGVVPDDGWMDEEDIRELVARVDPGFAQVGDAKAMRRVPSSPDVDRVVDVAEMQRGCEVSVRFCDRASRWRDYSTLAGTKVPPFPRRNARTVGSNPFVFVSAQEKWPRSRDRATVRRVFW
jgi:hypothetical protein